MSAAAQAAPITAVSIAQLGLSLALIIALIFGVSWLLKRTRLGGSTRKGDIAVLSELSVGPRDRILLVGVGDAQVLVGVSPAGMVALQPLVQPILLKQAQPSPAFADKLRDLMQRQGGA